MGRHDTQQDRQLARTLEELDKALRRRDVREAAASIVKLPVEQRAPHLDTLAPLVRTTLAQLRSKGAFGEVSFFAARVDAEPRLVSHGATAEEADEARWTLLLAALKGRDKPRAQRHLEALASRLSARPGLAAALEALATTGAVPPSLVAGLPSSTPDARLGHARSTRPAGEPPLHVEDVPGAVAALFADRSAEEAVRVIDDWSGRRAALASALAREALGPLGLELSASAASGHVRWDLARAFVRLVSSAGGEDATLPFRWMLARHSAARVSKDPSDAAGLTNHAQLVKGLLSSPTLGPVIRAHLAGLEVPPGRVSGHVRALARLVDGTGPDLETWVTLVERVHSVGEQAFGTVAEVVTDVLQPSFRRLLAAPTPFADRLAAIGHERVDRLLHAIEIVIAPGERLDMMRALEPWTTRPEFRPMFEDTLGSLLEHQSLLDEAMAEMFDGMGMPPGRLPPMMQPGRQKVLSYFGELSRRLTVTSAPLAEIIATSSLPAEVIARFVRRYLEGLPAPEPFIHLLTALHACRRRALYAEVEAAFTARFAHDGPMLARAWKAVPTITPHIHRPLAELLAALPPEQRQHETVVNIVESAYIFFPGAFSSRPRLAARKKKAPTKKAPAKKVASSKAPAKKVAASKAPAKKTAAKAPKPKASGESPPVAAPAKRASRKAKKTGPEGGQP